MAVNRLMGPGDRSYTKVYSSARTNVNVKNMYNRDNERILKKYNIKIIHRFTTVCFKLIV